jgi:hypothetical protein
MDISASLQIDAPLQQDVRKIFLGTPIQNHGDVSGHNTP